VHGIVTSLGWIISPVQTAGLSPTQYKIDCMLFWDDLDPVSFWAGFDPLKKTIFLFDAYDQVPQIKKKIHIVFSYNKKKTSKNMF